MIATQKDIRLPEAKPLKVLRRDKGIGRHPFAAACKVSSRTIFEIENGTTADPKASTVRKLAEVLECHPLEILEFREAMGLNEEEE